MTSQEELVTAAGDIRALSNKTKVWVYRFLLFFCFIIQTNIPILIFCFYSNLVWAPSWFTDVRQKLVSHPEWFIKFKPNGPWNNTKCTEGKCSDLFHAQFQTPGRREAALSCPCDWIVDLLRDDWLACAEYHSNSTKFGSCDDKCDCGTLPCGWYLWNHTHPDCRAWMVDRKRSR